MKATTGILYLLYFGLTVAEIVFLMFDHPIPGYENDKFFFSLLATFGCAGTGGFGFIPGSMELFSPYSQYVMAIFLLLFGCNFSLYYLILLRKFKEAFKSEELRVYFLIVGASVLIIFLNLLVKMDTLTQAYSVEEAFRHSLFQVASIITTAGFSTTDFAVWPTVSTYVLFLLMFIGGMAGSTAGGIKTSRLMIALKGTYSNIRKLISPRSIPKTKLEGKSLNEKTVGDVFSFLSLYFFILIGVVFLLSFDPINGTAITIASDAGEYTVTHGFFSNFSATLACISNIGPGFEAVGPYSSFAGYSLFSKILLSFTMILGRLEILPVLILFSPKTWKKI
jgi:trk system potassium uptake protein TrkH